MDINFLLKHHDTGIEIIKVYVRCTEKLDNSCKKLYPEIVTSLFH